MTIIFSFFFGKKRFREKIHEKPLEKSGFYPPCGKGRVKAVLRKAILKAIT